MNATSLRIVFAGTTEFAAIALQALVAANYPIAMVYTKPDQPAGRGRALHASPVKILAQAQQLPVRQPTSLKTDAELAFLRELQADVMIVAAYGLILPPAILAAPRYGCLNIHASLLPRFRGAAPIQQAILAGDSVTGVTIMQMDAGLDTGPMLYKMACPIAPSDTAADLQVRLAHLGAEAVLSVLADLQNGLLMPAAQDETQACYAAKITKANAQIDWTQSAVAIARCIRAFNPAPIAFTLLNGELLRIFSATVADDTAPNAALNALALKTAPGTILNASRAGVAVATGHGVLWLQSIQFAGGKILPVAAALNAKNTPLRAGTRFSVNNKS